MSRAAEHVHWFDRAYGVLLMVIHIPLIPLFLRLEATLLLFTILPIGLSIIGMFLLLRIPYAWSMFCAFAVIAIIIAPILAIFGLFIMVAVDAQSGFRLSAASALLCAVYAAGLIRFFTRSARLEAAADTNVGIPS